MMWGRGTAKAMSYLLSSRDNQVYDYLFIRYRIRPSTTCDGTAGCNARPLTIRKIEILDSSQRLVRRLNLLQLAPRHQIQALDLSDERANIRVEEGK